MNFIRKLFEEYDGDNYVKNMTAAYPPLMLASQIMFWFMGYFVYARHEGELTVKEAINEALTYGFGGIIIFFVAMILSMFFGFFVHKKPYKIIILAFCIVGTLLMYGRLR